MRTRERKRTHWEDCWRVHHECAVAKVESLAARLEGEEVLAKGWTSRVWSDASGHPIEVWQKGSKENGDIPVSLVRRREGGGDE